MVGRLLLVEMVVPHVLSFDFANSFASLSCLHLVCVRVCAWNRCPSEVLGDDGCLGTCCLSPLERHG